MRAIIEQDGEFYFCEIDPRDIGKKRRGRPPKAIRPVEKPIKRKVGRPRKERK